MNIPKQKPFSLSKFTLRKVIDISQNRSIYVESVPFLKDLINIYEIAGKVQTLSPSRSNIYGNANHEAENK